MNLARVFPRRTKASPVDELAFFDEPGMFLPGIDEVHVSVTFTEDLPRAESLARAWQRVAPTSIGGPACGEPGGNFVPGRYLKPGYVITSRGCPNRCWFCSVWKREGNEVRELPITEGWNVLDDNLLACSEDHIRGVFAMLKTQRHPVEFTGGMEAARLKPWHVEGLLGIHPKQIFFAYDTVDDYEPLVAAGRLLQEAGFMQASHSLRAYVLGGYPGDAIDAAEKRLRDTISAGFMPQLMVYRDGKHVPSIEWRCFARQWSRPAIIAARRNNDETMHEGITREPQVRGVPQSHRRYAVDAQDAAWGQTRLLPRVH
jgi:hypothetical protein